MNVIIPDSVLRFLALPLGGATQPAPPRGQTLPVNPLASGVIGTPGCFISPGHCESSLNSTAPEQRAVGRPGMDPKGFENHGITGRDDLYPLAGLGSNPPPTPAVGLHGQTPGTDFQEPPDGLLHAGLHRPCGWQTGSIRKHFYDRRGRSSSMTHF